MFTHFNRKIKHFLQKLMIIPKYAKISYVYQAVTGKSNAKSKLHKIKTLKSSVIFDP